MPGTDPLPEIGPIPPDPTPDPGLLGLPGTDPLPEIGPIPPGPTRSTKMLGIVDPLDELGLLGLPGTDPLPEIDGLTAGVRPPVELTDEGGRRENPELGGVVGVIGCRPTLEIGEVG